MNLSAGTLTLNMTHSIRLVLLAIAFAAMTLTLATGCQNEPAGTRAVWSERLPFDAVREQLPTLAERGAALYLAVRPDDIGPDLRQLVLDANSAGVEVRPWLQLPDVGLWLNEGNAVAFRIYASAYADWAEQNGIKPGWLIFDLEPAFEFADELFGRAAEGQLVSALAFAIGEYNPEAFEEARAEIAAMVDELHERDIRSMAVTLPWVFDDLADGDSDLQDISNTPVIGIDWDKVTVMVYRTTISSILDRVISPGYVASYAEDLAQYYGDKAAVAVGTIGTAGEISNSGYLIPGELTLDVQAAYSGGVRDVSIFSLDGMVELGNADVWLDAAWQPTIDYSSPDPVVLVIRYFFSELDRALSATP